MSRMLRLLLFLLATAALVLTGCGGDDDGADADAAADTETESEDDRDEVDDSSEDVDDIAGMSEGCMQAFAAFSEMAGSAGFAGGSTDPEESLEQFQAFAQVAREEIRDDLELLGDAYARFAAVMVETGFDPQSGEAPDEETMAALTEAMEPLSSDEVRAASERVSAYFSSECDIGNE